MDGSADFEAVRACIESDYAGWADKTAGRLAELAALTERIRGEVRAPREPAEATAPLREWLAFFDDRHLTVKEAARIAARRASLERRQQAPCLLEARADTLLLVIRSFASEYQEPLEMLLHAWAERLAAARFLIIDVRHCEGGSDATGWPLVPWLYTGPIARVGCDVRVSPGNVDAFREYAGSPALVEEARTAYGQIVARMEVAGKGFVCLAPDDEIRLDEVQPRPERVAVLIGERCASATEEFLLLARQSAKVSLFGTRTSGCLDYSNVRLVPLPSGERLLGVPMTRSRRLPDHGIDATGITPDRPLPSDPDGTEFTEAVRAALAMPSVSTR